jgi:glycosyltransferase 2 family protein
MTLRRKSLSTILKAGCLGLMQAFLSGVTLWLVPTSAGLKIDPVSSMVAVFGVQALASVPISIGGSGISEFALQWYLSSVYGFSSWVAVVLWRLVSYQFVLLVTGIAFIWLLNKAARHGVPDEMQTLVN